MRASRITVALCALAVIFYFTFGYESPAYIGPTIAAITLTWSVLQLVNNRWPKTRSEPQSETPAPEQVAAAADWLADAVHESWRKEAAARRITAPVPVSVHWEWAGDLSPQAAQRTPIPGSGPPALPGSNQPGRLQKSGDSTKLHDEVYRRLPRGRLLITGEPGSGKTAAMVLLLLEALAWREKLPSDERSHVPVPVLLTLAGWDPTRMTLHEWAVSVLHRDYHTLRAPRYGGDAAPALLSSGRVALFLDGLDEMPENFRIAALRQLNTDVPGLRIVMTSRLPEYAKATRAAPLESAAVIELRPVPPAVAAKFLLHEQPMHNRMEWQRVADYIKENEDSAAAMALDNPLWLTLARETYVENDPTDILAFSTEDLVTAHLTNQFLTKRYPQQRARRWLGCLAQHLDGDGSRDLRWWRLGSMLHPATRILAVALATFLAGVLVCAVIETPTLPVIELPASLRSLSTLGRLILGLADSLVAGPVACIAFGSAYAIVSVSGKAEFEPSQVPLRLRGPRAMASALRRRKHGVRVASGFLGGLAGGIVFAIIAILLAEFYDGINVPSATMPAIIGYYGLIFGFAAGVAFSLYSMFEVSSDTGTAAAPLTLLAESRSRALLQVAIFSPLPAIFFVAGDWISSGLMGGIPDPLGWSLSLAFIEGVVVGLAGTISYIFAFTAWGQWLVLARVVLPLTGRLPWKLTGFLQDAYDRGVLRQAGAVYQFRHLTLQTHLSRMNSTYPRP